MPELQLPDSINDARGRAMLVLIERLAALDLVPLLVYRIDSVPDAALPFLAWQFDILSQFWQLVAPAEQSIDALTDIDALADIDTLTGSTTTLQISAGAIQARREVVKSAIQLHRFRGTPWAIKSTLATIGWPHAAIKEGQASWGGTAYPGNQGWAVFRVIVNLAPEQPVVRGVAQTIVTAINFCKPARAWLDSLWFALPAIADSLPVPFDRFTLSGIAKYQVDTKSPPSDAALSLAIVTALEINPFGPIAPLYNRHYAHSGITYGQNEPVVADPVLILNGSPVLHGG